MRRRLATAVLTVAAMLLGAASAQGAGMTTHAWMAEEAVGYLESEPLADVLNAQRLPLLSGGAYPDSGYAAGSYPGGNFGEITHWERFVNAYVEQIRSKDECEGRLAEPHGPCAALVAHLMGVAAHGMGDEMWDWMFEPHFHDYDEDPHVRSRADDRPGFSELSAFPQLTNPLIEVQGALLEPANGFIGTSEYVMDVIAIADHGRFGYSPTPPPVQDLIAVYDSIGEEEVSEDGILVGHTIVTAALAAERAAVAEADSIRAEMPFTSGHMHVESGGVFDTAEAIAGYYEAVWRKLHGVPSVPVLAAEHPERGEEGVPFVFQPPQASPGPRGGGAPLRIIAVFSNAIDADSVDSNTFKVLDEAGQPVPALDGYPRLGPYHSTDGTHSLLFYPATDLQPCQRYTAVVSDGLRDFTTALAGAPGSWSFETRSAGGEPCPPPPPPADPPGPSPGSGSGVQPEAGGPGSGVPAQGEGNDGNFIGIPPDAGCAASVLRGTPRANDLRGTNRPERILGGGDADEIDALRGDDCLHGGGGDDLLRDGSGLDQVLGGRGSDHLRGGLGRDFLSGGPGNDRIDSVRRGRDDVHCGAGEDTARVGSLDRVRGCERVLRR